jgi:rare lipoprotein A
MITRREIILVMAAVSLLSCTSSPRYRSGSSTGNEGILYSSDFHQRGIASYYGRDFHGNRTANGEIYDMNGISAAHRTIPFNTIVEVKNLDNGRKLTVRVNDRGPFIAGRIIDLSVGAAKRLGMYTAGTAMVEIRVLKWGDSKK